MSRIIDGLFGGTYPIAKAVVGDGVPSSKRSEQMSTIGVAHVLSSLIGLGLFVPTYLLLGDGNEPAAIRPGSGLREFQRSGAFPRHPEQLSCMVKPWEQGAGKWPIGLALTARPDCGTSDRRYCAWEYAHLGLRQHRGAHLAHLRCPGDRSGWVMR